MAYGRQLLTLDQLQVVGDLLQDGEAGQHQAVGASQPSMLTPIWPVPLAALHHQHSKKLLLCPHYMIKSYAEVQREAIKPRMTPHCT